MSEFDASVDTKSQILALKNEGLLGKRNVQTRIIKGVDHQMSLLAERPYFDLGAVDEITALAIRSIKR